jgi:serine phosphatase RsbU (regulator of sigma subunit)/pSer/pThr/pTyr-binding forkhead associated (FHA) protein
MAEPAEPRLIVTDTLGRRILPLDKPSFTIGRRSETDLRLVSGNISRVHAEIVLEQGEHILYDRQSRYGTFVNDERIERRLLVHGDRIRFGPSADVQVVFAVGLEAPSAERSAVSAALELRQMAALLEGLRALGSGRVLDEVLALVLDSAIEVTGAERGFIMLAARGGALEFTLARARGKITLPGRTFATSRKIPEQVFATGQYRVVDDLLDDQLAPLHTGTVALGIRHVLCTPLRLVRYVEHADDRPEEETIGVLYLDSRERAALGSAASRSALETLSAEAALAIENARLYRQALDKEKYEQELKLAAEIQQALLPAPRVDKPFCVAMGSSSPCLAVGGDFFDYVDLQAGQFGFIVGDVAGKGSPAALLSAAVLGMFSAESAYHVGSASVVANLNRGLFRRTIENRFLTAFYGLLAPDGSFTYTNAGHNAPVLVSPAGTRRLEAGGLVLGLFEHVTFDEETVMLAPGDFIVAFSDGVTEAFNVAGEEYGDPRLLASIERHRGKAPEAMIDGLLADVKTFTGEATQNDDLTLVIVQYTGHGTMARGSTRGI